MPWVKRFRQITHACITACENKTEILQLTQALLSAKLKPIDIAKVTLPVRVHASILFGLCVA